MADIQTSSSGQSSRGRSHNRGGARSAQNTRHTRPAKKQLEEDAELDHIGSLRKSYSDELEQLMEMFPNWTEADLLMTLDDFNGDLLVVIDRISTGSVSKFTEVTISKPGPRTSSVAAQSHQPRGSNVLGTTSGNISRPNRRGQQSDRGRSSAGRGGRSAGLNRSNNHNNNNNNSYQNTQTSFSTDNATFTPSAAEDSSHSFKPDDGTAWKPTYDSTPNPLTGFSASTSGAVPPAATTTTDTSSQPRSWAKLFRKPSPPTPAAAASSATANNEDLASNMASLSVSENNSAPPTGGIVAGAAENEAPAPDDNQELAADADGSVDNEETFGSDFVSEEAGVAGALDETDAAPLTKDNVEHLPDTSKSAPTDTTVSVGASNSTEATASASKAATPELSTPAPTQSSGLTSDVSASLQRQSTPVILPNRPLLGHKPSTVQFGSLGLNSGAPTAAFVPAASAPMDLSKPRSSKALSPPRVALPFFPRVGGLSTAISQPSASAQISDIGSSSDHISAPGPVESATITRSLPQSTQRQPQVSALTQSDGPATSSATTTIEPERVVRTPAQAQTQPHNVSAIPPQSTHSTAPAFAPGLPIPASQHQHQNQQQHQQQHLHQQQTQPLQAPQHQSHQTQQVPGPSITGPMTMQHPQAHSGHFSYNQFSHQQHHQQQQQQPPQPQRSVDTFQQPRDTPSKATGDLSSVRYSQHPIPPVDYYSHAPAFMPEPSVSQPQDGSAVGSRPSELAGNHAPQQPRYPDHYSMYPNPMSYGGHNPPPSVQHFPYGHNQWNRPYYYPQWNGNYRQGGQVPPYSNMNLPGFGPSAPAHEATRGAAGMPDYSRDPANTLSTHAGQSNQPPGFGGVPDRFTSNQTGLGMQGQQYGQQSTGQQPADDSLKAFTDSKTGSGPASNGLGQPGRPGSAANSSANQPAFGGYPQRYASYGVHQWGYGGN